MKQIIKTTVIVLMLISISKVSGQIGINTTSPNAVLDIKSSNQASPASTDGILIPKVDLFPAVNPGAGQDGMMVYLTTQQGTNAPGFYYWKNAGNSWSAISGNSGTLDNAYDFGGPGSGRTITADSGAVTIAGVDGFVAGGQVGSGATMPATIGDKLIWNPRKVAFRAGGVSGSQWNDASTGYYSAAMGLNCIASNDHTMAFGLSSTASGLRATAFGRETNASGESSTASGYQTTASKWCATAFGSQTVASGDIATAFGYQSQATGNHSMASGFQTIASGWASRSHGTGTQASGTNATAFGYYTNATNNESTALGTLSIASGYTSASIGFGTVARSYGESSFGIYNTDYAPAAVNGWSAADRVFSIGNGMATNARSDAFVVQKNGLATLPSSSIGLINGASGKAVLTKEWFNANRGGLNEAYNNGGAGLGRTINANAGAVMIQGNGGLNVNGITGIGVPVPEAKLDVSPDVRIRHSNGNSIVAEITTNANPYNTSVSQNNTPTFSGGNTAAWQSFQATQNSPNFYVSIYIRNSAFFSSSTRNITIYQGWGTGGPIVGTYTMLIPAGSTSAWRSAGFYSVPMVAGQYYTIGINNSECWYYDLSNPYAFGTASWGGDFAFRIDSMIESFSNSPFRITGASDTAARFNLPNANSVAYVNGRIGIGVSNPQAPLHVVGSSYPFVPSDIRYFNQGTNLTTATGWADSITGYFEGNVISGGSFIATNAAIFSDARIKKVIGISDRANDLKTLNAIEIVDYTMVDSINNPKKYKKVLAQQVEKFLPDAVSKHSEYLPSVYAEADEVTNTNGMSLIKLQIAHHFKTGDEIRMISEKQGEIFATVEQVAGDCSFIVKTAQSVEGKLFVYGKKVDDFRAVDYDAIAMLNVSATQELYRLLMAANEKNAALEKDNQTMKAELSQIKSDMAQLKDFVISAQQKTGNGAANASE